MPRMPVLYFVRHGETDWNREARLQGQQDIDLNELGRRQARAVAPHLAAAAGGVEALRALPFLCSPLRRARETMERMRAALGFEPGDYRLDDRLKELSFGAWEGRTWREIRRTLAAEAQRREADKWNFEPPQGESYAALARRIAGWLAGIEADSVVVAHGGVARALLVLRGGMAPQEAAVADIWQGRVLLFRDGGAGWLPDVGDAA